MPSPFPGMNPYLVHDSVFHGFHRQAVVTISGLLVPQVRPQYIVGIESTEYVHDVPSHLQFPARRGGRWWTS